MKKTEKKTEKKTDEVQAQEQKQPVDAGSALVVANPQAPAIVPGFDGLPQTLEQEFTDASMMFYSSIKNDGSREAAVKIYSAMNETQSLKDWMIDHPGAMLDVVDIIAHHVSFVNEDGEIVESTRVVLVTDSGNYHAIANGVISSIKKLVGICGQAPWNPALKILPRQVKVRSGFYTLVLDLKG